MGITAPSDIWVPDVVAALAIEQSFDKIGLLQTGYIGDARRSAIREARGTTVNFPYMANNTFTGVQANNRDGNAVTPDKLDLDTEAETVLNKIISFQNDEKARAMIAQMIDPNQYMADLVTEMIAEHVQQALITKGATATLTFTDPAGAISIKGLKRAMVDQLGEKGQTSLPLVICHSHVAYDLETSTEIMQVGVYGLGNVGSIEVKRFGDFLVWSSDQVPSTDGLYTNIILQPGALELWMEPEMGFGEQRKPSTTAYVSDWWFEYATHFSRSAKLKAMTYKCYATID